MNSKSYDIDIELIARHLAGETSPAEEERLAKWLESGRENRRLFGEYKELWNKLDRVSPIASTDLDREWQLLKSRITGSTAGPRLSGAGPGSATGPEDRDDSPAYAEDRGQSPETPAGRMRFFPSLAGKFALAASVVVLLGSLGIYLSRHVTRTFQASTSPQEFILQDGSAVTLNRNSSLTCPLSFRKNLREVTLKGEGYFEVEGAPDRPFVIHAGKIDVRVTGTTFNVSAYKAADDIEVTVRSGEVTVSSRDEVRHTLHLTRGSMAVYHKPGGQLEFSTDIDRNYLSWKTRSFIFDDRELGEIAELLNEVYGANISIPSDSLRKARITTTFKGESLDAILHVLSATLDFKVVHSGDRILLEESK